MLFIGIFLVNVTKASAYRVFFYMLRSRGVHKLMIKKNIARIVNSLLGLNYFSFL